MVIAALTALWLASGLLSGEERVSDHPPLTEAQAGSRASAPTAVRAKISRAVPLPERVKVRGRTENKRTVDVRAETTGRVVERPIERGDRVKQGDLLCRLALADRQARRKQADAAVEQARLEHQGSLRLQDRGLQSETAIAQAKARLAGAQASLAAAALDIERTSVRAPFDAVVEDVGLERRRFRAARHGVRSRGGSGSHAACGPCFRSRRAPVRSRRDGDWSGSPPAHR